MREAARIISQQERAQSCAIRAFTHAVYTGDSNGDELHYNMDATYTDSPLVRKLAAEE